LTGEVIETAVAPGEKSEGDLRAGAAGVEIAGGLGAGIETFGVAIGIGRLGLGIEIGRDSAEGGASGGPAAVTETDGAATETGVEGRDADTALPDSSAPQA
jgi:hypothetical protein